jgi:hypothetical protein
MSKERESRICLLERLAQNIRVYNSTEGPKFVREGFRRLVEDDITREFYFIADQLFDTFSLNVDKGLAMERCVNGCWDRIAEFQPEKYDETTLFFDITTVMCESLSSWHKELDNSAAEVNI